MLKQSAGILVFRRTNDIPEVLLAHPAGPFWSKRDSWSIPKGELDPASVAWPIPDNETAARATNGHDKKALCRRVRRSSDPEALAGG